MPFSNHRGFIAGFLQDFWEGGLVAIESAEVIVHEPVHVRVLAGQDGGAGWAADGVTAVGSLKEHAFFGDAIDIWSGGDFVETSAVRGNGFQCMVIGEDKNNIGAFRGAGDHDRSEEYGTKLGEKFHIDL